MQVKQTRPSLVVGHSKLIFKSLADLERKDLTNVIGRFDGETASFLSDGALGQKYQALYDNGVAIHLARDNSGNYYLTDLIDNVSFVEPIGSTKKYEHINLNEKALDECIDYLPEDDFLVHLAESNDSDSYIPLVFTTNAQQHEFTIGHISGDKFTLNDGLPYFDFTVSEVENDDGDIVAYVDNASLNGCTLLKLTNKFKALDTDDEPVIIESYSNPNDIVQMALQFVQRNGI
ncbi:hypothetical protein [Vibrio lentus]|uniref:Uncharacterized protein n=1 Tax=Vibrio lentus TaxID=136468 RepID=A0A2N7IMK5_9VIBR|nr:hypothetical protein [Vibrio lentus]PML59452.1 hypothetical protein BCT74_02625 [Vibrio lentus]PMM38782.1 hypothetical protein BCT58_23650 [Vibrio lentus]